MPVSLLGGDDLALGARRSFHNRGSSQDSEGWAGGPGPGPQPQPYRHSGPTNQTWMIQLKGVEQAGPSSVPHCLLLWGPQGGSGRHRLYSGHGQAAKHMSGQYQEHEGYGWKGRDTRTLGVVGGAEGRPSEGRWAPECESRWHGGGPPAKWRAQVGR